jgi:hypothetical protein
MSRRRAAGLAVATALVTLVSGLAPLAAQAASSPQVTLTIGKKQATGDTPLTFTVSDPDSDLSTMTLDCRVDDLPVPCRPGVALPYATDSGRHTFWVKAVDPGGLADTAESQWTVTPGSGTRAYVKGGSTKEWAYLDDGAEPVVVKFGVDTTGSVVSGACWLNRERVRCPLNRPGGATFVYEGRVPAGNATLVIRAVDSNGKVVTARRHFWSVFPSLEVSVSPQATRSGDPLTATISKPVAATIRCVLNHGTTQVQAWSPCPKRLVFTLPSHRKFDAFTLHVKATSALGTNAVDRDVYVDRVAPRPTQNPSGLLLRFPKDLRLSWGIRGQEPLPVRYEAQVERSAWNEAGGRWRPLDLRAGARSKKASLGRGDSLCLRVRATDQAGNRSGWTKRGCRARPLDERDLKASGVWNKISEPKFYEHTGMWAGANGSKLVKPGVVMRSLVITGRKGPTGGKLAVIVNGRRLDTVSFRSAQPGRSVVYARTFGSVVRGELKLQVVSSGRPVTLDAVAIAPFAVHFWDPSARLAHRTW